MPHWYICGAFQRTRWLQQALLRRQQLLQQQLLQLQLPKQAAAAAKVDSLGAGAHRTKLLMGIQAGFERCSSAENVWEQEQLASRKFVWLLSLPLLPCVAAAAAGCSWSNNQWQQRYARAAQAPPFFTPTPLTDTAAPRAAAAASCAVEGAAAFHTNQGSCSNGTCFGRL